MKCKDCTDMICCHRTTDAEMECYYQAEKDLKLTWEDMRELHIIFNSLGVDIELSRSKLQKETLGYYEEVLKRFKEQKGE